jgi:hypothetical protein
MSFKFGVPIVWHDKDARHVDANGTHARRSRIIMDSEVMPTVIPIWLSGDRRGGLSGRPNDWD